MLIIQPYNCDATHSRDVSAFGHRYMLTLTHPRGPFFGTSVKLADVRQSNQRSLVSGYRQLLASQSDWLKPVTYESD